MPPRLPLLSLRPKTAIKITFQLSQWVTQEEGTESLACWPSDTLLLLVLLLPSGGGVWQLFKFSRSGKMGKT